MNQLIKYRSCDKMKGHNNVTKNGYNKSACDDIGLRREIEIVNALFSLFILLETAQVWNRATTVRNFRNFNRETSSRYVRANPCFAYCMC